MNRLAESIFALIFSTALPCATASAQRPPNVPRGLQGYLLKPLLEGRPMPERTEIVGHTDNRRAVNDMMGQPAEGYYVRTHRWHFMW